MKNKYVPPAMRIMSLFLDVNIVSSSIDGNNEGVEFEDWN